MIKLIASDLDGTLLPPNKVLPERVFELIEKLHSKGVVFAPASGRQLPNLQKLFAPVLDKIAIIAENGGIVWYGGEVIYTNPTPEDGVIYALEKIAEVEGLYPLLSCADCAYYKSKNKKFVETVEKSYCATKRVEDLESTAHGKCVLKISVWDERPPCAEHGGVLLPPRIEGLRVMVSGFDWLDVSVVSANKGAALNALAKKLGVERREIAAFGDHMNDLEMLQESGNAFVTANAFKGLKDYGFETVPSNADFGVIKKVEELILKGEL